MTRDIIMESTEARIALIEQFIERKFREHDELVAELGAVRLQRKYCMIPSIKKKREWGGTECRVIR